MSNTPQASRCPPPPTAIVQSSFGRYPPGRPAQRPFSDTVHGPELTVNVLEAADTRAVIKVGCRFKVRGRRVSAAPKDVHLVAEAYLPPTASSCTHANIGRQFVATVALPSVVRVPGQYCPSCQDHKGRAVTVAVVARVLAHAGHWQGDAV